MSSAPQLRRKVFSLPSVQSAENLPLMPYLFRPGRVAGTREHIVHPNYIVVYQIGDDGIDILRMLHSRQQYPWLA